MTARPLYQDDPLLFEFEARVTGHATHEGRPALLLDRSAFYPESGGQMADRGRAQWEGGAAALIDAQLDGEGRALHVLALEAGVAPPPEGAPVRVWIDADRRREFMSLHTGQHMLSRALVDLCGAETVSSRLGETLCTINTPVAGLDEARVQDAAALVNRVVAEDRPVHARYPDARELSAMDLRRAPKVERDVRIIDIDGFNLTPCGGTHCPNTARVGGVHVLGLERYKGGTRVSFHAGPRALRDYAHKDRVLQGLARELTCGVEQIPAALAKLRAAAHEAAQQAGELRSRLARALAAELLAGAQPAPDGSVRVAAALEGESQELLRAVATAVCAAEPRAAVALVAPGPEGSPVVVQRGEAAAGFDAGRALRALAEATGGRGGGRPDRAEGRLPPAPLPGLDAALAALRAS